MIINEKNNGYRLTHPEACRTNHQTTVEKEKYSQHMKEKGAKTKFIFVKTLEYFIQ